MTKELLQQCLDALIESRDDVDLCYAGVKAARLSFREERQLGFYEEQLVKHDAAIEGLKQALAQQEQPNPWSEAVIDQLVVHHIYQSVHDTEPRKAIYDLLCMNQSIALDPQVSSDAQALIDRGRKEAQQEQPAQEPVAWYLSEDSNILGVEWSRQKPKYGRDWTPLYKTAPTQPALSDAECGNLVEKAVTDFAKRRSVPREHLNTDLNMMPALAVFIARAIEAHCRGGAK